MKDFYMKGYKRGQRPLLALALALVLAVTAQAQQLPQFSLYSMNANIYNPAVAGMEDFLQARAGYRQQNTGISDGPGTLYVNVHGALNQKDLNKEELGALPMRGASSIRFKEDDAPRKIRHGLGGFFINDKAGQFIANSGAVSYAIHLPVGRRYYVSFGAQGGLQFLKQNADYQNLRDGQSGDAALSTRTLTLPQIGLGGMFYSDKFYVGVGIQQLTQSKIKFGDQSLSTGQKQNTHYYLNAGYRIKVGEDFDVIPQLLGKYTAKGFTVDPQVKVRYQQAFWVGAGYRGADADLNTNDGTAKLNNTSDAYTAMVGLTFNNLIDVAYAYDFVGSQLSTGSNGSHEIVLGVRLYNSKKAQAKMW